jgi:hypothetical protein
MLATGAVDKNTQKRVISFSRKHKLLRISDAGRVCFRIDQQARFAFGKE